MQSNHVLRTPLLQATVITFSPVPIRSAVQAGVPCKLPCPVEALLRPAHTATQIAAALLLCRSSSIIVSVFQYDPILVCGCGYILSRWWDVLLHRGSPHARAFRPSVGPNHSLMINRHPRDIANSMRR